MIIAATEMQWLSVCQKKSWITDICEMMQTSSLQYFNVFFLFQELEIEEKLYK